MAALLHDLPICFKCSERVETPPVFAAICGHERCPSVVFHGLCLMEYREHQERAERDGAVEMLAVAVMAAQPRHAPGCPNDD